MSRSTSSLPDLDALSALVERLEGVPELAAVTLEDAIRVINGKRAIFAGSYAGTPAIIRFYLDEPRAYARRDWEELTRLWAFMADGIHRVNKPLIHYPDLGLVVVRKEPGKPMLEAIWQAEPEARASYMPQAADWLRHYTAPTERYAAMRAPSWLTKAEKRLTKQAFARLRPLLSALQVELRRLVPAMVGKEWRVAICHGDFHPNNLLVAEDGLIGIDTGGSAKLPIYKDMARFTTHMGRRGLHPSGEVRFGVDNGTLESFAAAFKLDAFEREVWLPFMIGIEGLLRVETEGLSRSRIRRAMTFYEGLLEDLRGIDP